MRKSRIFLFFLFLVSLTISSNLSATHLRAGEITVKRVNCSGLTFDITITVYTDNGSDVNVLFGGGELRFGDEGNPDDFFRLPLDIPNNTQVFYDENGTRTDTPLIADLGPDVAVVSFTIRHTYGSQSKYLVSYVEANRNAGILNIEGGNSVNTTFYIETEINIDGVLGCNNTPVLLIPPIDRACPNVAFYHNPGAFDSDGDSLSFELVTPKKDVGTIVANYISPAARQYYENFNSGNETADGQPTFKIDARTGEIEWNAPGKIGEYNVAFIVKEWRFRFGEWFLLGFVTRDMQIIVEDCDNERPELIIPEDICVEAGETINEIIYGTDPDNHDVKIEAFSQLILERGATVIPATPIFQSSTPAAQIQFIWNTECLDVRDQPYTVVFKITDNPAEGPKLVSFATWNITVVGPSPVFNAVTQDGQSIRLDWDQYLCNNAESIQIWRRVDTNPYLPDECETGIRENSGYSLLTELPPTSTTYRDTNLAAAAKYCYRILGIFPFEPGGESIVSQELCYEFVPAEEPVITHVSVEKTDKTNGEIIVAWREPFELGTIDVSAGISYRIYRSEGFDGESFQLISTKTSDLSDSIGFRDTGLNTEDLVYKYKIAILDPSGSGTDEISSAPATSVRLEPTPQFGQIRLDWSAIVPWSNSIATPPNSEHLIFRGNEGDSQADFQLIASVDISQFGFSYVDSINLKNDQIYCYRIQTKGTYGNPAIKNPQLNFSQIVCAQPSDSIPPCAPIVTLEGNSCEEFINSSSGSFNDFKNQLNWTIDFAGNCQNDIKIYQIYYAITTVDPFELLAEVTEEEYLHNNLSSFKGCYKVRAIDRSGNIGEFSNILCVDNCPYYELPNVFTPGNQDECNDTFRAYGDPVSFDENGVGGCGTTDAAKAARFVRAVDFTVINRWGKEVYRYSGSTSGENSIYIRWNGKDSNGGELSAGVYYYAAEVTFDVVNPSESVRLYKGWIHILK